jgi:hypothetical protein
MDPITLVGGLFLKRIVLGRVFKVYFMKISWEEYFVVSFIFTHTHTRYAIELISNLPIDGTIVFMETTDFQHLMMFVFHHLNVLGIFSPISRKNNQM